MKGNPGGGSVTHQVHSSMVSVSPATYPVALGGSAGGLKALSTIIEGLACRGVVAYVLARYLSPSHASHLAGILGSHSKLAIAAARRGASFLPDHLYLCPPERDILLAGGRPVLRVPDISAFVAASIDQLFVSAAEAFGEKAVGVLLSGCGNDGRTAAAAIRAARCERWFHRQKGRWRRQKPAREYCVVSAHGVSGDSRSIHMDLISCRKLLRDFKPDHDEVLFSAFRHSLGPAAHCSREIRIRRYQLATVHSHRHPRKALSAPRHRVASKP